MKLLGLMKGSIGREKEEIEKEGFRLGRRVERGVSHVTSLSNIYFLIQVIKRGILFFKKIWIYTCGLPPPLMK